jgi:hypothetical protein
MEVDSNERDDERGHTHMTDRQRRAQEHTIKIFLIS